jgi:hypothetical protein
MHNWVVTYTERRSIMSTFAKIQLCSCPSISAFIDEIDHERFYISVYLTESSNAVYVTDPAETYRRRLSGEYAKDPNNCRNYRQLSGLPEEIVEAARASIARGGYNAGPCSDYFTARALKYFAPLSAWYQGGQEEYNRLLDKAAAKIEALRVSSDTSRLDDLCLALGLPRG